MTDLCYNVMIIFYMHKLKLWLLNVVNLYEGEEVQVLASWGVSFVYRIAMVLGWTAMVVYFVGKFEIIYLPLLLALHAFGNILGSVLFGKIVNKFGKAELLIYLSLLCSVFFLATGISFAYNYQVFLILSIVGVSVLLYQLKIMRSIFSESIFSPSQATRVFPVIESAETLGVIFGGAMVVALAPVLSVYKFFLVNAVLILLVVPIVFWFMKKTINVPFREFFAIPELGIHPHMDDELDLVSMFNTLKQNKFIFYLFGIVIFQFLFFGILEYHFTFVVEEYSKLHTEAGYDAGKAFAADLGLLHTVFGVVILAFQLFLASRLLNNLGVIRAMVLMPLVMIASVGFMIFNFGFPSVVLARFNQELMYVLHYNSYHASYYALSHGLRVAVMEFLEGVVRPLGTIVATFILLVLAGFGFENFNLITNVISVICLGVILVLTLKFKYEYQNAPIHDLQFDDSVASQMNALDLIKSETDIQAVGFLKDLILRKKDFSRIVRAKIYDYLGDNGEIETIYFLIERFNYGYDQYEVLKAINTIFQRNRDYFRNMKFSNYYLENFYDKLLISELDLKVKSELIRFLILFYMESNKIDELVDLVKKNLNPENCLLFSDVLKSENDLGFLYVFEEFLNYDDTKVKLSMLLVLDSLLSKEKVQAIVKSCLVSSDLYNVENALLYVLKSQKYGLYKFYEDMLKVKLQDVKEIFVLNEIVRLSFLKTKNRLRNYLSTVDLALIISTMKKLEEWYVDDELITIFKERIESEIYVVYSNFALETNPKFKLELLYTLKNCYKILGSQKEYFMMKDLLS